MVILTPRMRLSVASAQAEHLLAAVAHRAVGACRWRRAGPSPPSSSGSCRSRIRRRSRRVSPARPSKSMPRTACTSPSGVLKRTCRSRMSRIGVVAVAIAQRSLRIEGVAQAVAEEVQRRTASRRKDRREDQQPGAPWMLLAPSAMSTPRLVSGSCTPRPRKDRKLSSRITFGTRSVTKTMTGPSVFGMMWRRRMPPVADAQRLGRLHELPPLQGQASGRARCAPCRAIRSAPIGDEDQDEVAAEEDHQQDDEEDEGQRIEDVDDAHHDVVDAAAEIAGRSRRRRRR